MVNPIRKDMTLYECSNCKRKFADKSVASNCCVCGICGEPKDHKHSNVECQACLDKKYQERDRKFVEKATLVKYDSKLVYHNNDDQWMFDGDGVYYYLADNYDLKEDLPEYLYVSEEIPFVLCAESVIENALDEHHEDAGDCISKKEYKRLQDFLNQWAKDQSILSWDGYLDKKVLVSEVVEVLDIKKFL